MVDSIEISQIFLASIIIRRCFGDHVFSSFDRTPTCHRRTDRWTVVQTNDDSICCASIVSHSENTEYNLQSFHCMLINGAFVHYTECHMHQKLMAAMSIVVFMKCH